MAFTIPDFEPYKRSNPLAAALSGYTEGKNLAQQIAESRARTGLTQAQQQLIQYKLENPETMAPEAIQNLYWLRKLADQERANQPNPSQLHAQISGPMTGVGGNEIPSLYTQGAQGGGAQSIKGTGAQQQPGNIYDQILQGTLMNMNPYAKAQFESQKKQLQAATDYGIKQEQNAAAALADANKTEADLNILRSNYEKSTYKGVSNLGTGGDVTPESMQGFGALKHTLLYGMHGSPLGHDWTPEQNADIAADSLRTSLFPLIHGKVTDNDLKFFGGLKPSRILEKGAFETQADKMQAGVDRAKQYAKFMQEAKAKGFSDPYARDRMWNTFMEQREIFNSKGEINKDHIKADAYKPYLSNEAYQAAISGAPFEVITDEDIKQEAKNSGKSVKEIRKRLKDEGRL